MSNRTKARLLIGLAIAILLGVIPLVAMAQTAPPQLIVPNAGYHSDQDWDICDWFPNWPGCQPPPPKCYGDCPTVTWSAHKLECPVADSAYTSTDSDLPCKRKINNHWRYADKVVTDTFTITFTYDKDANDPHKCHRPTAQSLGIPSWAVSKFNQENDEWKYAPEVPCSQPCDETVLLAKVYGPIVDVGLPLWGPWIDNGDGTFTRTGNQATTRHWTQTTVDAQDPQHVCGVDEGDDAGSREVKESKDGTTRYAVDANCNEGFVTALYFDPDGGQVGSEIVAEYVWSNPFDLESHLFEQYDLTANEPEDCHEIEVKIDFADEDPPDCIGWAVYRYTYVDGELYSTELAGSGTWSNVYLDESFTFYDEKSGLSLYVQEPQDCTVPHRAVTFLANDCLGWEVGYIKDGETFIVASNSWNGEDKLESDVFPGFIIEVPEGEDIEILDPLNLTPGGIVSEPASCFECQVEEKYRMLTLVDDQAPEWYWGKGARNGTCWIIMHEDGTFASVGRQAEICSVCAQPDFVFNADRVLYDAYVMIDCEGNVLYPDPLWDPKWYRANYDNICHEESCLLPEVKPTEP